MKLFTEKDLISIKNYTDLTVLEKFLNTFSVTKKSKFKDDVWLLDTKPDERTIIFKINSLTLENKKVLLLWKLVLFLILSNMTKIKIRNKGILNISYNFKQLVLFLYKKNI